MSSGPETDPLRQIGIYFYFPERRISPEAENYTTMAIVDGLTELGYPCYSNVAHPQLIEKPLAAAHVHVVVFEITSENWSSALMGGIAEFRARAKLIHCRADETPVMTTPDVVTAVMTHENRFLSFRQKRLPWAFGLSRTRIARHANTTAFSSRRPVIVRNFRPALQQSVRESLDLSLLPLLERHFEIDRTIATDNYAERLANSVGCLAYGGCYTTELTKNASLAQMPVLVELVRSRTLLRDPAIIRWDSWRFWESLAAGCLTFQLDFEEYGFVLPEMPVAWKHYVPLKLHDLPGSVTELMDRKTEWESIANAGRTWALEHYSPVASGRRFAEICRAELIAKCVAA